jgi:hypothetical protein
VRVRVSARRRALNDRRAVAEIRRCGHDSGKVVSMGVEMRCLFRREGKGLGDS